MDFIDETLFRDQSYYRICIVKKDMELALQSILKTFAFQDLDQKFKINKQDEPYYK